MTRMRDRRCESVTTEPSPHECARLICKLSWIGLDDEARSLQRELNTVPPDERPTVSAGPFSTD